LKIKGGGARVKQIMNFYKFGIPVKSKKVIPVKNNDIHNLYLQTARLIIGEPYEEICGGGANSLTLDGCCDGF
jgi:hypothetical protein